MPEFDFRIQNIKEYLTPTWDSLIKTRKENSFLGKAWSCVSTGFSWMSTGFCKAISRSFHAQDFLYRPNNEGAAALITENLKKLKGEVLSPDTDNLTIFKAQKQLAIIEDTNRQLAISTNRTDLLKKSEKFQQEASTLSDTLKGTSSARLKKLEESIGSPLNGLTPQEVIRKALEFKENGKAGLAQQLLATIATDNMEAQIQLAILLVNGGAGVETDKKLGKQMFLELSKNEQLTSDLRGVASYELGLIYEREYQKNPENQDSLKRCIENFKQAVMNKNPNVCVHLCKQEWRRILAENDFYKHLKFAKEEGLPGASYLFVSYDKFYAYCLESEDHELLVKDAKNGIPEAQFFAALSALSIGRFEEVKQWLEAVKSSERLTDAQKTHALHVLGILNERGLDCEPNLKRAEEYYKLGDRFSSMELDSIRLKTPSSKYDNTTKVDDHRPSYELRAKAERGILDAYRQLANSYKDPFLRFHYASIAADNGCLSALPIVAAAYLYGCGASEDHKKAFELLERACNNGDLQTKQKAAAYLAICYYNGWGVEKDRIKAKGYVIEAQGTEVYPPLFNPIHHY